MASDEKVFRFPVYLKEEDWGYWQVGFSARSRRGKSESSRQRSIRIALAISQAVSDAVPDGEEEVRYPLYLTEPDYVWLQDALRFVPKKLKNDGAAKRIERDVALSYASMEEVEDE
ncbi:hypothetical protein [Streptomyces sp. NPDC057363]|uniref:hypothetical protein n=1 Tax=Streptomyces sp. NPDC057363 TaxID=3346107 RepID=UPI00363BC89D